MNRTRCISHAHIPRVIIVNRHKQPRLPSTVSIMASGGMAELRAAEQKAAQIVQEARAGKAMRSVEGTRAMYSCFCRLPSVFLCRHPSRD